jgi:dipeptidase E
MKFYLSSYKIGNEGEMLKQMVLGKMGYIPNARDFTKADPERNREVTKRDMGELQSLGMEVEVLDLRIYFGKPDELRKKIDTLGGVWVSGGNTFVLRQAMKISGFDTILLELIKRDDFVYGGYSAAGCVLSPSLTCYQIVDDPTETPYEECKEILLEGLGLIDFCFMPHYDSDHAESKDINKEIQYCVENHLPYKTLRDGEAIIIL